MADTTWNEHGYNQWNLPDSVERATEAISVINQVCSYLWPAWQSHDAKKVAIGVTCV